MKFWEEFTFKGFCKVWFILFYFIGHILPNQVKFSHFFQFSSRLTKFPHMTWGKGLLKKSVIPIWLPRQLPAYSCHSQALDLWDFFSSRSSITRVLPEIKAHRTQLCVTRSWYFLLNLQTLTGSAMGMFLSIFLALI